MSVSRALLSLFFFCLVFGGDEGWAVQAARGKIERENYVNFRSGPGLSHPPMTVLRRGEEVEVEGREGNWYRVSLSDGRKGYVYWEFVEVAGKLEPGPKAEPQEKPPPITATAKEKPAEQAAERTEEEKEGLAVSVEPPLPQPEKAAAKGDLPAIIEVLEKRGWNMLVWVVAGICIFILGWICGGNYYLRRDRIRRTKIHF